MRTVDDYTEELKALLPEGPLWTSLLRPGSVFVQFLRGLVGEFVRVDARAENLLSEADPRSTYELLPTWEQALVIQDGCSSLGTTIAQRQADVTAKLLEQDTDSRQELIDIADAHGFAPASITEFDPFTVQSTVDAPLYDQDWRFAIKLTAAKQPVNAFTVDSTVDETLGDALPNAKMECAIRRMAPAHCVMIHEYV